MTIHSKSKFLAALPYRLKVKILEGLQAYGRVTAPARLLPNFMIIGAQRSGTSALYSALIQHPDVRGALRKEVHFFDLNYHRGLDWYRAQFPPAAQKWRHPQLITGEASPYYLFYPHAPQRVWALNPAMKLIVLLRSPVDRAYSHYQHEVRLGVETLSFEEAIDREEVRLEREYEKIAGDDNYQSFCHQHFTYLGRGRYAEQLQRWQECFPQEQMLILQSEAFFTRPEEVFAKALSFLGLTQWEPPVFQKTNALAYREMSTETRHRLEIWFEPYNQELYRMVKYDFLWGE